LLCMVGEFALSGTEVFPHFSETSNFPVNMVIGGHRSGDSLIHAGILQSSGGTPSTHREATAAVWHTFHHDGKLAQAGEGGGCTPTVHAMTDLWFLQYLQKERKKICRNINKI